MHNLLWISLILSMAWIGCRQKPDPISPLPQFTLWQEHPAIRLDNRFLIAGHATEDHLFLATPNRLLALDRSGKLVVEAEMPGHPLHWAHSPPLLGDRVAIFPESTPWVQSDPWYHQLQLKLRDPLHPERYTLLDLTDIDSNYFRITSHWNCPLAYTADHRLVVPVQRLSPDGAFDSLQHVLVFAIEPGSQGPQAQLEQVVTYHPYAYLDPGEEIHPTGHNSSSVHAVGSEVYLSIKWPGVTFKVGAAPRVEFVTFSHWSVMAGDAETAYMFGEHPNGALLWGERRQGPWEFHVISLEGKDYRALRGKVVGGEMVAYRRDQLLHFDFRPDNHLLEILPIATTGMEVSPIINDLVLWHGQVYLLTTHGLYYKPDHEFFQAPPSE